MGKLTDRLKERLKYAGRPYKSEAEKKIYEDAYSSAKKEALKGMAEDRAMLMRRNAKERAMNRGGSIFSEARQYATQQSRQGSLNQILGIESYPKKKAKKKKKSSRKKAKKKLRIRKIEYY